MKAASLIAWTTLILTLSLSAAEPEETAPARPGTHDAEAMALLQSVNARMPLGKIGLGNLMPELVMEMQQGLSWQEAVVAAYQHFGNDPTAAARALFLRKYLKAGMPESCLDDLKLVDSGVSTFSGSGRTRTLITGPADRPVAKLHFSIAHREKTLTVEPVLEVIYHPMMILLESATFDTEDRLTGWRMRQPRSISTHDSGMVHQVSALYALPYYYPHPKLQFWKPRQDVFEYGANLSGKDGSGFFWVSITHADGLSESISFSDPKFIKDRRVRGRPRIAPVPGQPGVQTSYDLDYHEIYEDGRLLKRVHHGQRKDEHGTVSVVVKEERL